MRTRLLQRMLALGIVVVSQSLLGCIGEASEPDDTDEDVSGGETVATNEEAVSGCITHDWVYLTNRFCYLRTCPYSSCAPREGIGAWTGIAPIYDCPTNGYYYMWKVSSGTPGWVHESCF